MCLYVFTPGKELQVTFASETIVLVEGGSQVVLDLFVTNLSDDFLNCLHIVYPRGIQLNRRSKTNPTIRDITYTWLIEKSLYNRFYYTGGWFLKRKSGVGLCEITIGMPSLKEHTKFKTYEGVIRGDQKLGLFEFTTSQLFTDNVWEYLANLEPPGWSVFTIKFKKGIEPRETRVLRLEVIAEIFPNNQYSVVEHRIRKILGLLSHRFAIEGPENVRFHFINSLKSPSTMDEASPYSSLILELQSFQSKMITGGLEAPGTNTIINDWRLNVLAWKYRRIDEPIYEGDIQVVGNLYNKLDDPPSFRPQMVFQWKAGKYNVEQPKNQGFFIVRICAHDIPLITILLPWISLGVGILSILLFLLSL